MVNIFNGMVMFSLLPIGFIPYHQRCRVYGQYLQHFTYMYIHVGTRNAAKTVAKVCHGTLKEEGKTWFHQLSDKSVFISVICIMWTIIKCATFTIRKKYQGAPLLLYEEL